MTTNIPKISVACVRYFRQKKTRKKIIYFLAKTDKHKVQYNQFPHPLSSAHLTEQIHFKALQNNARAKFSWWKRWTNTNEKQAKRQQQNNSNKKETRTTKRKKIHNTCRICKEKKTPTTLCRDVFAAGLVCMACVRNTLCLYILSAFRLFVSPTQCSLYYAMAPHIWLCSQPSLSLACGMLTLLSWHDCIVRSLCHPIYLYLSRSVYWFLLGCLTMMKQQFRSMQYIKTAHMSFVKWHVRFLMLLYLLIYLKLFHSTSACINYKHSEQFQNQLS